MKYFLDSFGCAKNQVDAENMMARLNDSGWSSCEDAGAADLIIVNSCGFIEAAKRESINAVLGWKDHYPEKKILLAGCLARRYRSELGESLPEADGLLGCDELETAPEKAAALFGGTAGRRPDSPAGSQPGRRPGVSGTGRRPLLGFPGQAYVKISEGCDNRCSFCAIPLIRGPLRCRPISDIVSECGELLRRDVKELCLIGQDLASFRVEPSAAGAGPAEAPGAGAAGAPGTKEAPGGPSALARLLRELASIPGDFWVRTLYLHPDHIPLDILEIMEGDGRLLPYFDIPFQHASPSILKTMNRRGSAETYLGLIETIRSRLPDAVIRSTFLTGFPGETEEDFRQLLEFQERARFDWLGVFTWSREEDTPAYSMKGRVPKKTAAFRKALIEERQIPITEKRMDRFVGREMEVLLEEELPGNGESIWLGRLKCQAPEVDGAAVILHSGERALAEKALAAGSFVRGRVSARTGFDLQVQV